MTHPTSLPIAMQIGLILVFLGTALAGSCDWKVLQCDGNCAVESDEGNSIGENVFSFRSISSSLASKEQAFEAYRAKRGFISRAEFDEIDAFIRRMQEIQPWDLLTENDFRVLKKMGFNQLLLLAFPPFQFDECRGLDSQPQWEAILRSFPLYKTRICFSVRLLELLYCYRSVDSLSREDFFAFYTLVDYFQGGKQYQLIRRMEFLDQIFAAEDSHLLLNVLTWMSGIECDSTLKNSELLLLASRALFSADEIAFSFRDFAVLEEERIYFLMQTIFDFYAKGNYHTSAQCSLKKLEIKHLPPYLNYSFERMLRKNARALRSLSISHTMGNFKVPIRFPNLTEISCSFSNLCLNFEFSLHSNYTKLQFDNPLSLHSTNQYFKIDASDKGLRSLLLLLESNVNLKHLKIRIPELLSPDNRRRFKVALSRLRIMESVEFYSYYYFEVEELFQPDNSISTLSLLEFPYFYEWESIEKNLKGLKHFTFKNSEILGFDRFLEFLSRSSLETLSLPEFFPSRSKMGIFNILNELKTLKTIRMGIYSHLVDAIPSLDSRFKALYFQLGILPVSYSNSIFHHLPPVSSVEYLALDFFYPRETNLNQKDLNELKMKFPNLKCLYLHNFRVDSNVEFKFEVYFASVQSQIALFQSVPCILFGLPE